VLRRRPPEALYEVLDEQASLDADPAATDTRPGSEATGPTAVPAGRRSRRPTVRLAAAGALVAAALAVAVVIRGHDRPPEDAPRSAEPTTAPRAARPQVRAGLGSPRARAQSQAARAGGRRSERATPKARVIPRTRPKRSRTRHGATPPPRRAAPPRAVPAPVAPVGAPAQTPATRPADHPEPPRATHAAAPPSRRAPEDAADAEFGFER
jgi:hypothetical protein